MGEGRTTSRPRLCLSCATCRRRKVRCTKEQPACHSCVLTNEECKYDEAAWKKEAQNKRKKAANNHQNKARSTKRQDIHPEKEQCVDWIRKPFEPIQSQSDSNEDFITQPDILKQQPHKDMPHTAPDCRQRDTIDDNINCADSSATTLVDNYSLVDNYFSDAGQSGVFDDFSNVIHWSSGNHESLSASSPPLQGVLSLSRPTNPVTDHPSTSAKPAEDPVDRLPKRRSLNNKSSLSAQNLIKSHNASARVSKRQGFPETGRPSQPSPGHFGVRDEARSCYVGAAFWGYFKNCEPFCETLLRGPHRASRDMPHPHIDCVALTNLLSLLPSRLVCNTLLYSFLIGVRSVYPLIHVPNFRADYDDFWHCHTRSNFALQNSKLANDPTFLCLLFSVLYCGAAASPPSFWGAGPLQSVVKEVILEQLAIASSLSLKAVQHLRRPTFHSLVALLLRHSCLKQGDDSNHDFSFVSTAIRIAQSMGLHLEPSKLGFDVVDCEMRRRIWWHILWLDLQNSIFTGLPLCFQHNDAQNHAQMVGEAQDRDICEPTPKGTVTPSTAASSASMLFAIGRFETARFERMLVNHLDNTEGVDTEDLIKIESSYAKLQLDIDTLIARIPTRGIPEKGLIPSRLANASPLSQRELYTDHMHEATVFTSWTRIMLTMLKTEAAILFQRVSVEGGKAKTEQDQRRWDSINQLCIAYLRNFLQTMQIAAFAPYTWFCSTYFGPLQAVFLILVYVQNNHDPESEPQALYLVDEVIDFFVSEENSNPPLAFIKQPGDVPETSISSAATQLNPAWTVLNSLRLSLPSRSPFTVAQARQPLQHTTSSENDLNLSSITNPPENISTSPLRQSFSLPPQSHTPSRTPTFPTNSKPEPSHYFQTGVTNALSPLFTPQQDMYDTFRGIDDNMDVMVDIPNTDSWSDIPVQAPEDDVSMTPMEKNRPEPSYATPTSQIKTPAASVSEKSWRPWPSKVTASHEVGTRREGTSTPGPAAREAGRERGGGGRSTPHVNGNGGKALEDVIANDDFWTVF